MARSLKHTLWTGIAGYGQQISQMATGLLLIRAATHFLAPEKFGIWSFTFVTLNYFFLLDLGISSALARLLGEPLAMGDAKKAGGWITLSAVVLCAQAGLIFLLGAVMAEPMIHLAATHGQASIDIRRLWFGVLIVRSFTYPTALLAAILFAQNRVYMQSLIFTLSGWINLGVFWVMLNQGHGVFSYVEAMAAGSIFTVLGWTLAVIKGPDKIKLNWAEIPWKELPYVFRYSLAVFGAGLASQTSGMAQTVIITRFLGLDAAAIFAVTSRIPTFLSSFVWRPFDSFVPRWQQHFCETPDPSVFRGELLRVLRFAILTASIVAIGIVLANPAFIKWWTKPEFYGGPLLNMGLAVLLIYQTFTHSIGAIFSIRKTMKSYAFVLWLSAVFEVGFLIILVKNVGLFGAPIALIGGGFVFPLWFVENSASKLLGGGIFTALFADVPFWAPFFLSACILEYLKWLPSMASPFLQFCLTCIIALMLAGPAIFRVLQLLKPLMGKKLNVIG